MLVFNDTLYRPGVHTVDVKCPDVPTKGVLTLQMISPWGQIYQDHLAVRYILLKYIICIIIVSTGFSSYSCLSVITFYMCKFLCCIYFKF